MKWIEMMVKKLTARYMSLNRQFKVQRHTIVCQSGMEDYVSVTIDDDVSEAFRKVYGNITIINNSK